MATRTTPASTTAKPATKAADKRSAPKTEVTAAPVKAKATPAPAAPKAVTTKPVAAKKAVSQPKDASSTVMKASTAPRPAMTTEQRNHYVAVAAFYIAERRGFTLGNPQQDWLQAEAEIDRLIASGHFAV